MDKCPKCGEILTLTEQSSKIAELEKALSEATDKLGEQSSKIEELEDVLRLQA